MSIGILFEDLEGHIVYLNSALRRIWRIAEGDVCEAVWRRN
jgi:PAS domain-containing protein